MPLTRRLRAALSRQERGHQFPFILPSPLAGRGAWGEGSTILRNNTSPKS